jgi:hypothetical protein
MDASGPQEPAAVLDSPVRVPEHIVARDMQGETVILDTRSGQYHGLNSSAAAMFAALGTAETPRETTAGLADRLGADLDVIERDMSELCVALAQRGLIELG